MTTSQPMLELRGLTVNYGGIQALQNINLTIQPGEVVTLIGANGAGKSTTLRAISRIVNARSGQIIYEGKDISRARADEVVKMGIAHSPEGRRVLSRQSVQDNLELGAYIRNDRAGIQADIRRMYERFLNIVQELHKQGTTILLVEQNASLALQNADRGYVLEAGQLTISGPAASLLQDQRVKAAYLG